MDVENTNNILEMDLDEKSAKYLQESLDSWKEGVTAQLMEEVETLKQSTIEALEEENIAYKQNLKEEYAEKMISALSEMREEIKAEIIAETVQNNPEIKVLEKIKEIMAPVIAEDYRERVYGDTILVLQNKISDLEKEKELQEGARTLASLVAPLSEVTQNLVLSLIKEGTAEEVEEQFYNILESLDTVFGEKAEADDEEEDTEEDDEEDADGEDEEADDEEDTDEDDEEADDEEDDESTDDKMAALRAKKGKGKSKAKKDEVKAESFIDTGFSGLNEEVSPRNSLRDTMKKYAK